MVRHKAAAAALWSAVEPRTVPASVGEEPGAGISRAADAPGAPAPQGGLVVDLAAGRVTYRGVTIPTAPPNNLQRQALVALACLAARPGDLVPMTDLVLEMQRRGRFGRRLVTPEPREIRYRIMRPFRRALKGVLTPGEIEALIDTVPGSGLRLNLSAKDCDVVPRQ